HAALERGGELGDDLVDTRRIDPDALALGLVVTAEEPRGLAVGALDLRRATLGRRRYLRLCADRAEQKRRRRQRRPEYQDSLHTLTPSCVGATGFLTCGAFV